MIKMKLIQRIKLILSLKTELLDFVDKFNTRYKETEEYCKKKEWKIYDNIHKTLNVVEDRKKNEISNNTDDVEWYNDRAVDISLKTFIIMNK